MSTITIPLKRAIKITGDLGEMIAKAFFKKNDIIVVAHSLYIPSWKVSPDFLITKNKEKHDKYYQLNSVSLEFTEDHFLGEVKRTKSDDYTEQKIDRLRAKIKKKNPMAIIYTDWAENSIKLYDKGPHLRERDMILIDNYCFVEVKTSAVGRFPKIQQNVFTPGQRKQAFYDHVLRIKLETNFDNGFSGTIHEDDVKNLLSNPKLY